MYTEDPITGGICRAIANTFAGSRIALGPVRQGLRPPHFFVMCRKATQRVYLGRRFLAENEFRVTYLPADETRAREECAETAQALFVCLAEISTEKGTLRGTRMAGEFDRGQLNFSVRYDYFFYRRAEIPAMGELAQTQSIRADSAERQKG